jgi:hypothetical protein
MVSALILYLYENEAINPLRRTSEPEEKIYRRKGEGRIVDFFVWQLAV